ncbi:MAG: NAD(P)/FAD-dependent oxidoreductase, partial [Porticoccaceae bacterium]
MLRLTELKLPLDHTAADLRAAILSRFGIADAELRTYTLFRRGQDARKRGHIQLVYTLDIETTRDAALLEKFARDPHVSRTPDTTYRPVTLAPPGVDERPVVIGFGPCGLFAALILAESGFRPIVLERGKAVRERTRDTWALWRERQLDPESNVQFGEGGAGTFSDGKLYSQIKDPRHLGRKVLAEFVAAGAPEEIRYVSKPHIGTFRLVTVVQAMREKIIALGGEVRFRQQVTDLLVQDRQVTGVQLADGTRIATRHVVLAVGHSARDTFRMLHGRGVHMEPKPFSIGLRVEHPQSIIDRARFGTQAGHPL